MKLDQIEALGFTVVAGQIDRLGKNYGLLTPTGPALTPEGEALALELQAAKAPKAEAPAKPAKEPKASKTPKVETPAADTSGDDLLQGLLDE
jgi:hypothetical protein